MRTEKEIRDELKEYEENIEFLNNSKLGNKKLIQELKQEIAIFKWVLNEIEKI